MRAMLMSSIVLAPLLTAQDPDMVAVSWSGQLHALDSRTGALADLGLGPFGQNDLASDGQGRLWSTARTGSVFSFFLTRVDPVRGEVTFAFPSIDLRALATAGPGALWGIETVQAANSRLWHIDTATGVHTLVGDTGTNAIQSLCVDGGTLYGWQWVDGLLRIDPTTGVATDPFAATAANLVVQWLAVDPRGGLLGGTATGLYHIDTMTGTATLQAPLTNGADLRGARFTAFALPFGRGCDLGNGDLELRAGGELRPGGLLTLQSRHHLPGTVRGIAVGFSRRSYGGVPLPWLLDPLLGTSGCSLYVSVDATMLILGAQGPTTIMSLPARLPPGLGPIDLYVQHFDAAQPWDPPGASNGLMLHILP